MTIRVKGLMFAVVAVVGLASGAQAWPKHHRHRTPPMTKPATGQTSKPQTAPAQQPRLTPPQVVSPKPPAPTPAPAPTGK